MSGADWAYLLLAVSPVGGILAAVPLAVFELRYAWPLILVSAPPLAYVQVIVVDLAGRQLDELAWWRELLARRRSARIDRVLRSRGGFWPVFFVTPLLGPWFIMALMSYAGVPQRRITLPVLASMFTLTALLTAACLEVPSWFGH